MRTYKRKTTRGLATNHQLWDAAEAVMSNKLNANSAAKTFDIKRMTLVRYIAKLKAEGKNCTAMGYKAPRQVFTQEQEDDIKKKFLEDDTEEDEVKEYSSIDVRRVAYEYAIKLKIPMPTSWAKDEMAGMDWFRKFSKRNPEMIFNKLQVANVDDDSPLNLELLNKPLNLATRRRINK